MGEVAKQTKVATQMGNQGTADSTLRESAALIQAGAIGNAKHVHIWTNRPVWPQGLDLPTDNPPVPSHVHWKEWIGPAKTRPYNPIYHPFKWRGWWDFGTGALGDMACHTLNMSFMALNLRNPTSVQATTSGHNKQTYPKWSQIEFEFPADGNRPAVKMTWYDGGKRPDAKLLAGRPMTSSGALVEGDKASLYSPGDYGGDGKGTGLIVGGEFIRQGTGDAKADFERSPGHFVEYANAIKGGKPARSNFAEYAGPLSETVLLGNLAVWAAAEPGLGKKIEWDAQKLVAKDADDEIREIIKNTYHNGYALEMG
jgi:predicted dehydrogenase